MVRDAVRALVLDPDDRILLVRFVAPWTDETWWSTPGGGLDGNSLETFVLVRVEHGPPPEVMDVGV